MIFATSVLQLFDRELLVLRELRPDVYQGLTVGTVELEKNEKNFKLYFLKRHTDLKPLYCKRKESVHENINFKLFLFSSEIKVLNSHKSEK